jgi:hypothetical protein
MRYLDYDKHDQIVQQYFGDDFSSRSVGKTRAIDSGYIDIVRFFGQEAVNPAQVAVKYDPTPFTFSDALIAEFSSNVEKQMRAEGRLYDGPLVMKLKSADFSGSSLSITVQFATYGQQAGSCFALDLPHELFARHGGTLRRYWKEKYRDTSVESNPLAICFGVCGFLLLTESGKPPRLLCQHRTGRLASLESSIGPSVAGSVDWTLGYNTLSDLVQDSMTREITEELGLCLGEYAVTPLAYAREIFRGEKPQIFCAISTSLRDHKIESRIKSLRPHFAEHDSFEWITLQSDYHPDSFNHEARMNYYLLEEFSAG